MIFSFLFIYIFVVNIVYYVVHIVCQVDVIANSLVLYLPFCSTLNKNFFFFFFFFYRPTSYTFLHRLYLFGRCVGFGFLLYDHGYGNLNYKIKYTFVRVSFTSSDQLLLVT